MDLSKHNAKKAAERARSEGHDDLVKRWEELSVPGCQVPMAFPPALKFADATVEDQVTAIFSEARELADALHGQDPMWLMELLDLHHATETLYRILANTYGPEVLNNARARVIQKNLVRGYYADTSENATMNGCNQGPNITE